MMLALIIYCYFIALHHLIGNPVNEERANDQLRRIKKIFLREDTSKTVKKFCLKLMKEIYERVDRSEISKTSRNGKTKSLMLYRIALCELLSGNVSEAKVLYQQVCDCLEADKFFSSLYLSSLVNFARCLHDLKYIEASQKVLEDASNILQNMPADVKFSKEDGRENAEKLIERLQGYNLASL